MMLTVGSGQMKSLAKSGRTAFVAGLEQDVSDFLRRSAPALSEDEIEARWIQAWRVATGVGMETERQLTHCSYLVASLPLDFSVLPEFDWLVQALRSPGDPDTRLAGIDAVIEGQSRR